MVDGGTEGRGREAGNEAGRDGGRSHESGWSMERWVDANTWWTNVWWTGDVLANESLLTQTTHANSISKCNANSSKKFPTATLNQ